MTLDQSRNPQYKVTSVYSFHILPAHINLLRTPELEWLSCAWGKKEGVRKSFPFDQKGTTRALTHSFAPMRHHADSARYHRQGEDDVRWESPMEDKRQLSCVQKSKLHVCLSWCGLASAVRCGEIESVTTTR